MTTVRAPARVLVTGASGFLAAGIVQVLVQRGYTAVGTVRSASKGEWFKKTYGDKFEYVVVEDMEKPGAYDEAVKTNIDAIIHSAAVVVQTDLPLSEFINPTVQGTVGTLESARLHAPSVKRIIITSSVSAITEYLPEPKQFTHADWNQQGVDLIEKEGDKSSPITKYGASKVLSERAAWDYIKKHDVKYEITTLCPPLIIGPLLTEPPTTPSLSSLNASMNIFYQNTFGTDELEAPWSGNWIDLRDTALAHVLALEVEEAKGKRLLVADTHKFWQEIRDELRQAGVPNVPEGTPGSYKGQTPHVTYEGQEAAKLLGLRYRPFVEYAKDAIEAIRSRYPDAK